MKSLQYASRKPTYFFTVDYSVGFGSYAGPTEFLLEIDSGKLHWLAARDSRSGKESEITLAKTLKSDWRFLPRSDGNGMDIFEFDCRPDFSKSAPRGVEQKFDVIYHRYHFDGTRWVQFIRSRSGFWESDEAFPNRNQFP